MHTDTLIQQTRTKSQVTPENKMNKQMQLFSFSPPKNFSEEGKLLLAASSFDCTNSVLKITDENTSFSISTPDNWGAKFNKKANDELNKLLELRSQNGFELHVEQVRKKSVIRKKDYSLSSLGTFEN